MKKRIGIWDIEVHKAARAVFAAFTACFVLCDSALCAETLIKPAEYLAAQPKPNFKQDHRLPHLTRWGWQLSSNACVELARNWGYALDLGWANSAVVNLQRPNSMESGFIALAKSDPRKFALSVLVNRSFPAPIPDGFWCTNSVGLFVDDSTNQWQFATNTSFKKFVSPEGPDDYWRKAAEFWAQDLRIIQSNAPIAIVLNGGEYGLDVPGFAKEAWLKDPRVQAATNGMSIARYASNRKAHQLGFLTKAIEESLPNRELSIFYHTGNEQYRYAKYWPDWSTTMGSWGWNSDVMVANSDLPSFESYFIDTWTTITNPFPNDILTRHLNAVGFNRNLGYEKNYSWVCGGWGTNSANFSEISRYMGFLKCLYTSGMVGGVAGYFEYPKGGFDASFSSEKPPHWLSQILALSYVHALFSHLDEFLQGGHLLPGPSRHSMSDDQPAYEFPTGDATVRVLVRKHASEDRWVITAWAAAGDERDAIVGIPDLGEIRLRARPAGSVYHVTRASQTLIDVGDSLAHDRQLPPSGLTIVPLAVQ